MKAVVVVASNRAAAGVYEDTTGPLIVGRSDRGRLRRRAAGGRARRDPVGAAIREAVDGGARAVVTTGGTGLTPTDLTPEVTRPLLDREVPGVAEAIRAYGVARACRRRPCPAGSSGVGGSALVVNLPGSRGGVKDGLAVVVPLLRHAVEQIAGSDH